ncbi:MAG: hypothetical protein ACP5R0_03590 [Thermoplasmata archaeon]
MQKGSLGKVILIIGFLVLTSWYIFFSIYMIKYPLLAVKLVNNIFFWLIFILSIVILFIAVIIMRTVRKDAIGKVFKIEKVYKNNIGSIRHLGLKAYVICPDTLKSGDYVKITGVNYVSTGRANSQILVAKKLDINDPEYPIS